MEALEDTCEKTPKGAIEEAPETASAETTGGRSEPRRKDSPSVTNAAEYPTHHRSPVHGNVGQRFPGVTGHQQPREGQRIREQTVETQALRIGGGFRGQWDSVCCSFDQ